MAKEQAKELFPVLEMCPPVRPPDDVPKGEFEIGLACAGAVSAGAYIAGVMDFLVQALDAWEAAKKDPAFKGKVPDHSVKLTVLTGASAGAINSAIFALLRHKDFTHFSSDPGEGAGAAKNPLFQSWVNAIDMSRLTGTEDLDALGKGQQPLSLLDSTPLDRIGEQALIDAAALTDKVRDWVADPLRVYLTQTNTRGVPYFVGFIDGSGSGQGMVQHADQARFVLFRDKVVPAVDPCGPDDHDHAFPDERALAGQPQAADGWRQLPQAALGSSAFPIGLAPRDMTAKPEDYLYRITLPDPNQPGPDQPQRYVAVQPEGEDWPQDGSLTTPRPYLGMDGGIIDNDPFGLARDMMAGRYGRNPRDGLAANRSVIMIDPFPERPPPGPTDRNGHGLKFLLGTLVNVLKLQARFRPEDLILAQQESVYSRFIIVPKREGATKQQYNLACGLLGGFGGFLARPLRVHDYLNGRRNCQRFLAKHFTLPRDNPLFDSWRDAAWAGDYDAGGGELPIIPLLKTGPYAIAEQAAPEWPDQCVDPDLSTRQVMDRVEKLVPAMFNLNWLMRQAVKMVIYPKIRGLVKSAIRTAAKEWGVLNRFS